MNLAATHPLYEQLRPCRGWLSYSDWRDIEGGRYERVAAKLARSAKWWLYSSSVMTGGLALMGLYDVWRYFSVGRGLYLALAISVVLVLVWGVPRELQHYRALAAAASSLHSLAVASSERGATGA